MNEDTESDPALKKSRPITLEHRRQVTNEDANDFTLQNDETPTSNNIGNQSLVNYGCTNIQLKKIDVKNGMHLNNVKYNIPKTLYNVGGKTTPGISKDKSLISRKRVKLNEVNESGSAFKKSRPITSEHRSKVTSDDANNYTLVLFDENDETPMTDNLERDSSVYFECVNIQKEICDKKKDEKKKEIIVVENTASYCQSQGIREPGVTQESDTAETEGTSNDNGNIPKEKIYEILRNNYSHLDYTDYTLVFDDENDETPMSDNIESHSSVHFECVNIQKEICDEKKEEKKKEIIVVENTASYCQSQGIREPGVTQKSDTAETEGTSNDNGNIPKEKIYEILRNNYSHLDYTDYTLVFDDENDETPMSDNIESHSSVHFECVNIQKEICDEKKEEKKKEIIVVENTASYCQSQGIREPGVTQKSDTAETEGTSNDNGNIPKEENKITSDDYSHLDCTLVFDDENDETPMSDNIESHSSVHFECVNIQKEICDKKKEEKKKEIIVVENTASYYQSQGIREPGVTQESDTAETEGTSNDNGNIPKEKIYEILRNNYSHLDYTDYTLVFDDENDETPMSDNIESHSSVHFECVNIQKEICDKKKEEKKKEIIVVENTASYCQSQGIREPGVTQESDTAETEGTSNDNGNIPKEENKITSDDYSHLDCTLVFDDENDETPMSDNIESHSPMHFKWVNSQKETLHIEICPYFCQNQFNWESVLNQENDTTDGEDFKIIHQNEGTSSDNSNFSKMGIEYKVTSDDKNDFTLVLDDENGETPMSDNIESHSSINLGCDNIQEEIIDVEKNMNVLDNGKFAIPKVLYNVGDQTAPVISNDRKLRFRMRGKLNEDIESGPALKKTRPITSEHRSGNTDIATSLHTKRNTFSCRECSYKTAKKSLINKHLKTHKNGMTFCCDKCEYKCSRKSRLNQHSHIHTGTKQFACNECDYKCNVKANLKRHLMTHIEKPVH